MTTQNPYAAPQADVELPSSKNTIQAITNIPRFSTWGVFGLAFITFGFYAIYWLYSRTRKLNAGLDEGQKIPNGLIMGAMISYLLYIVLSIAGAAMNMPIIGAIGSMLLLVYFILYLIWIYKFRSAINNLIGTKDRKKGWIGPILTLFLNVYYFQYKINQIHDNT